MTTQNFLEIARSIAGLEAREAYAHLRASGFSGPEAAEITAAHRGHRTSRMIGSIREICRSIIYAKAMTFKINIFDNANRLRRTPALGCQEPVRLLKGGI